MIQVIGETCDIVVDAVERYKAIILTEARIARIFSQGQVRSSSIGENATVKGTLTALDIRLGEACEEGGNHWPHLRMKESCKLSLEDRQQRAFQQPLGITRDIPVNISNRVFHFFQDRLFENECLLRKQEISVTLCRLSSARPTHTCRKRMHRGIRITVSNDRQVIACRR